MPLDSPFTEQSNEMSSRLDGSLPALDFMRILRTCDSQIFGGYKSERNLFDTEASIEAVAEGCTKLLKRFYPLEAEGRGNSSCVLMTGCGTSGRIAFLTSRRYNRIMSEIGPPNKPLFEYAIAGGDSALLLSDEIPEDDPLGGAGDVLAITGGYDATYLVGVSCGLSAPYVAGQVALSCTADSDGVEASNDVEEHARTTPVPPVGGLRSFISPRTELISSGSVSKSQRPLGVAVLGFNPANLARNVPLEGLENKSFRDVIAPFDNRDSWPWRVLVNPVLGPEAVSGSSRMKGGSATLVVLDIICLKAVSELLPRDHHLRELAELSVSQLLNKYQQCLAITYSSCTPHLPQIMDRCAQALRSGGRIYYIGTESAAVVGCIDVSEMPDTYGAPFDQTRAFIVGGWGAIGNKDGDISSRSHLHRISLDHFIQDVLPKLGSNDSVVVLISGPVLAQRDELRHTIRYIKATEATLSYLIVCSENESVFLENNPMDITSADLYSFVEVPSTHEGFHDFSMKIMVNAVSTYSQAAGRGAIYKSHMIATGPANDKIYVRCLGLIAMHLNICERDANVALIRSIYGLDSIDEALLQSPRSVHINKAVLTEDQRHQSQIILPVAFLLASDKKMTVEMARKAVSSEPRLDLLLKEIFANKGCSKTVSISSDLIVGIDIGGTNIRAAVISGNDGTILGSVVKRKVEDRSPQGFLRLLGDVYDDLATAIQGSSGRFIPVAIGVGQPGHIDEQGCVSKMANYPNWGDQTVPVKSFLQERSGCSHVVMFNDADTLLAAEVYYGAGRLSETVAMLTVGTGIGAALAQKGVIHRGSRGLIEGGHMIVDPSPDAQRCGCGQQGCLETYCSGPAIARLAEKAGLGNFSAEDVVTEANAGNVQAEAVLTEASRYLAIGILNTLRVYDPDVLVIGGGLASVMTSRVKPMLSDIQWKIHDDRKNIPIVVAACEEPGVQGAAALAFKGETSSNQPSPLLRRALESDRLSLYSVCLRTGDSGQDGRHLFSDPHLLGSIYVGPYLSLSKQFSFCLVYGTGVGYVLGVLDTRNFEKACEEYWWPHLREKYPLTNLEKYRENERQLIESQIHSRPELDADLIKNYPSHLHIDLTSDVQGKGYGVVMVNRLLYALTEAGSTGVHLTMSKDNSRAFAFYKKMGFNLVKQLPLTNEQILARRLP